MACRTGCKTKDHESYGACLRDAQTGVAIQGGSLSVAMRSSAGKTEVELTAYQKARREGIQPASTQMKDIKEAVALTHMAKAPYDATNGTFKK